MPKSLSCHAFFPVFFKGKKCSSTEDRLCSGRIWYWMRQRYRQSYIDSYDEIQTLASQGNKLYMKCLQNIIDTTGGIHRAIRGYSDIYYIPAAKMADFVTVGSIFFRHKAFLEVAIPSILVCMSGKNNQTYLFGISQADQNTRPKPWINIGDLYRKEQLVFYHATKWKSVLKGDVLYTKLYNDTLRTIRNCTS